MEAAWRADVTKNLGFSAEILMEVASRYTSRTEFREQNISLYKWAYRRGLWQEASSHMRNRSRDGASSIKWTKKAVMEAASRFHKKSLFISENPGAIAAARKNGWVEEACQHMARQIPPAQAVNGRPCNTCGVFCQPLEMTSSRGRIGSVCKACHSQRAGAYWRANPGWKSERTAARRARLLHATPIWLTAELRKEILSLYKEARTKSASGVPHEVDHIVPLSGKTVCGLHVPWNMRVITKVANRKKSNCLSHV